MSSPYPVHIEAPIRYTPTAELDHSQLMKLYQLAMPAIEDLSWEDVTANTIPKLKEYSNVYGARAEGVRLPRIRAEIEIFFTAWLHSRYVLAPPASKRLQLTPNEIVFDTKSKVHPSVRELALDNGLALHLSQRYELETIAAVAQLASEKGGIWVDDSTLPNAVLIMEEIANAAGRRVIEVKQAADANNEMLGTTDCLKSSDPWQGWCGFRSGIQRK